MASPLLAIMRTHSQRAHTRGFDVSLAIVALALLAASVAQPRRDDPSRGVPSLDGTLVVADLRGRALVVLDLATGASRRIAVDGGPHELLRLSDGRIAASLEQAGRVALVDLASDSVDYLDTGGLPHGLLLDEDVLLVTDRAAGAIRRIHLATGDELPSIPTGALPHQLAASGRQLLVADASSDTFTLAPGRAVWQPEVTESLAVSPDGARVAFAGALDGRVRVISQSEGEALDLAVGGRPVRLAYDHAGTTLAVALSAAGEVAFIDALGHARRVEVGGVPDGLAFDASGRLLYASDIAGGKVSVVDVEAGEVRTRFEVGVTPGAMLYLPPTP